MDNLVNSLVTKSIGLTDQQVFNTLTANPNMNDAQIVQFMKTNGVSPSQMSKVTGMPEGQIGARVAATIPQGFSVTLGDTVIAPQYQTTGSGMDQQIGALESFATSKSNGDINYKAPVGTPVQIYNANGEFVNTVQTKKDQSFIGGIKEALKDPVVLAAIGGAAYGAGAFGAGGSTALNTLGSAALDADIAGGLIPQFGTNAAANAFMAGAMTPEAIAALGATVAAAPEVIGSGNMLTTAAANAVNPITTAAAAKTLIDPITGLALSAAGNVAGSVANQAGITDARNLINQYGGTAKTAIEQAYADSKKLNVSNTAGINDLYANIGTRLSDTLKSQVGAYDLANTNINKNTAAQMGLLASNYAGQRSDAASNAAALNATYGTTKKDLGDIYREQIGFQKPYQDVGQRASTEILANTPYFTRQFDANDLNAQLAPNYAFQLAQGQMANQRLGNMGGGAMGGNVAQGLQKYTQDYAGGAYQKAFENFGKQRADIFSTLKDMAAIGTTSGAQLTSLGNAYGTNLGSLSSNLGSNLTSNTGNLLQAGSAYGANTTNATGNLNSALATNLNALQGAYNQYGSNLTSGAGNYANALTTSAGQGINAANVYGTNQANLATGIGGALASNATATGANTATALNNLANTALIGSMIKAT